MAEIVNGYRCVTLADLDGLMSYDALAKRCQRGRARVVRPKCPGRPALYDVDSLPANVREEVYRRHPDLEETKAAKEDMRTIVPDSEAHAFYAGYDVGGGRRLPDEAVRTLCNNAAILNMFRRVLDSSDSERIKTSRPRLNRREFWTAAGSRLGHYADEWPNTLPTNWRRLQETYGRYVAEGYAALVSGKYCNSNASRLGEEQRHCIAALCAIPNGLDNVVVAGEYNRLAGRNGWKTITPGTVARIRREDGLVIDAVRHGNSHFMNNTAMQVTRNRPSAAMLMWSLDGWDCELYYQQRNGRNVTVYTRRKVLEVVLDPCCDYPIGYAVGDVENEALIAEALRDAVDHTRELFGRRLMTSQLQSDHFAMKAMAPYYSVVAQKITPARVKNAKAKPIERYFRHLNDTYCKTQANWSGYGITADKEHQPSPEFQNMVKRQYPDGDGVTRQIEAIIAKEREAKRDEYMRMWEATPEERRLPVDEELFLLRFGRTTGYTNVLQGNGVTPRICGRKRFYDSFDVSFRKYSYMRWEIRYDEADLSHVLAVSQDGTRRYMLEEKEAMPMALADYRDGDGEKLKRINDYNRRLMESNRLEFARIAEHATALLGSRAPEPLEPEDAGNKLAQALVTDSRGQHKTRRAELRGRNTARAEDADTDGERKPDERSWMDIY